MVQDAVLLDTRQHELRNIVNRRKRKLQELYRVTCATADALTPRTVTNNHVSASKKAYTETDFLDANDLAKGRVFDVTTLRRLPGAEPLFTPDGSYIGVPQLEATPSTSLPVSHEAQASPIRAIDNDGVQLLGRTDQSNLNPPNGVTNGSRPRSPISPVDESQVSDHVDAASVSGSKVEGSHPLAALRTRTPATPPAEVSDPVESLQKGRDATVTAGETLDRNVIDKENQPPPSYGGPERQLLKEVLQARRRSPSAQENGQPTNGTKDSEGSSKELTIPQAQDGQASNTEIKPPGTRSTPKPPMRIDTSVSRPGPSSVQATASAAATPPASAVGNHVSPPERMRTRVSSGAIRHKSVSEILGETPRTATHERTPSIDKAAFSPAGSAAPSRRFSQVSATPTTATFRRRLSDLRGKEKDLSHQSMVVFARQQGHDENASRELVPKRGALQGVDDYLLPLFLAQASGHSTGLAQLLASSRKTLTTSNHHLEARELRDCRILKRIYTLQSTNKWSLRQPARAVEPDRPATQWDSLLVEVKWMRTDFKEERKWKHAQARTLAYACADWVAASEEDRKELEIRARKPTSRIFVQNGITPESTPNTNSQDEPVPDLVHSNDDDTSEETEDDMQIALRAPLPPAAVFSLGPDDLTFALGETPVSQKLLSELPMYDPFKDLQLRSKAVDSRSMDESWRKPITLVSRWNDGKIVFPEERTTKRRKTSRYDYAASPEPEDESHTPLPPDEADTAMFRPENRHIIHRLHASHAFRLPPMPIPSQDFFLHRQPSQWTRQEEDALRRLVREYAFNWSLISSILSSSSIYSSGAERRTPWECFERWEMLEGMPNEYARHEFYKRWHLRRSNAKQRHEEQYRQAQEQAQAGQQVQRLRRSGEPQTVDRRRGDKHIYIFQSMAKLAKKREAQLQKQQHMAQVAAGRKTNEPAQNANRRMRTPAEFSNHKHKQEQEMRQKFLEHRQQAERARTVQAAGRIAAGQPHGMPSMPQVGRGSVPSDVATTHAASAAQAGMVNGQSRPMPPGQGVMSASLPNGTRAIPPTPIQYQQGQAANSGNARMLAEASRLSEQQRLEQRRLMQQNRQYAGMNGATQQHMGLNLSQQSNASFQNMQPQGGKLSPAVNGQRPVSATSPNGTHATQAAGHLSSGDVPAINKIKSDLKTQHPTLSDIQISQLATRQLNAQLHSQNQRSGTTNGYPMHPQQQVQQSQGQRSNVQMMQPNMGNGLGVMASNQQEYAAALSRTMQQQQSHHRALSGGTQGTPRPESRGLTATPQNRANTATPASAVAGSSQSPRPTTAQTANKP